MLCVHTGSCKEAIVAGSGLVMLVGMLSSETRVSPQKAAAGAILAGVAAGGPPFIERLVSAGVVRLAISLMDGRDTGSIALLASMCIHGGA